jgi:asparagine N-glycosylation enzyme membrane subunit Stt3
MAFETERALIRWQLGKLAKWVEPFLDRLPALSRIPERWLTAAGLLVLAGLAFFLRTAHLLRNDHYYVINVDSHYFHWLAGRVMAGQGPPNPGGEADIYTLHSGLAYPLAWVGKAVGAVFNLSDPDALAFASKFLPPFLGVIGMFVIYFAALKMFDKKTAFFSAFGWVAIGHAFFHGGAAGNIDRDLLSIALLTVAVLLFYFSRNWSLRLGKWEVGWLVAAGAVLVAELILYLEWNFIGPTLLLAVLLSYFALSFTLKFVFGLKTVSFWRRLTGAAVGSNGRALAVILAANLLAVGVLYSQSSSWLDTAVGTLTSGGSSPIDEMRGLWARQFQDLLNYHFFLIPMAIGLYVAWRNRDEASILFAGWFLGILVLSMFSSRILIYAVPAACFLSGLGLAFVWSRGAWKWSGTASEKLGVVALWALNLGVAAALTVSVVVLPQPEGGGLFLVALVTMLVLGTAAALIMRWQGGWDSFKSFVRRVAIVDLVFLMIFIASGFAMNLAGEPIGKIAAREDWLAATSYLRENSADQEAVMSWWDYGYWILDLAQRRPIVDNGYYGWDFTTMDDIRKVYLATDASEAAQIMQKYGATYLVFSEFDSDPKLAPGILSFPLPPQPVDGEYESFPEDSLFIRSLSGDFQSEDGLEVWYSNDGVVILRLDQATR